MVAIVDVNQTTRNELANTAGSEFVIQTTDTSGGVIVDQGNPATVGSYAWAVAQINARDADDDRRGSIKFGRGTFPFSTKVFVSEQISTVGAGLGATLLQFNDTAGGIQITNGVIHTSSRVNAVGDNVMPGGAAFAGAATIRYRCIVAGTSGTAADFQVLAAANQVIGNTFTDAGGAQWRTVAAVTPHMGNFSFNMIGTMTGAGLALARCNGSVIGSTFGTGGNATIGAHNVSIQVDACNKFGLDKTDLEVACHGILINITDITELPFNFGDGNITNVDITMTAFASYGLKFQGSDTNTNTINNILVNRLEIVGANDPASCQIGVWFHGAQRNTIKHFDCELCNVQIMETGTTTTISQNNDVSEIHHINSGQQQTEQYTYSRGMPIATPVTTPYTAVDVRENWLQFPEFAAAFPAGSTFFIADDEGLFSRDVTSISAPSGGFITCTMSAGLPSAGRNSIARHPLLTLNGNLPVNTSLKAGQLGLANFQQLAGDILSFGYSAADNYISPMFRVPEGVSYNIEVVTERLATSRLTLEPVNGAITLAESLKLQPKAIAPTVTKGESWLACSDGTGSGFDGASGAGLYVRNAADTAWVFIG